MMLMVLAMLMMTMITSSDDEYVKLRGCQQASKHDDNGDVKRYK